MYILCDGSTDASVREQETVYTRYVHNRYPKTKFIGIKNPVRPNAEEITAYIEEVLTNSVLPLDVCNMNRDPLKA